MACVQGCAAAGTSMEVRTPLVHPKGEAAAWMPGDARQQAPQQADEGVMQTPVKRNSGDGSPGTIRRKVGVSVHVSDTVRRQLFVFSPAGPVEASDDDSGIDDDDEDEDTVLTRGTVVEGKVDGPRWSPCPMSSPSWSPASALSSPSWTPEPAGKGKRRHAIPSSGYAVK